jgi:hypothetical protein
MNNFKMMVEKEMELQELNNQYGWQSCYDVPEAYDKMSDLENELSDLAHEVAGTELYYKDVADLAETLAGDLRNAGKTADEAEMYLYSRDDYFHDIVLGGESNEMAEQLYYWVSSDDRGKWLEANYLHDANIYTDKRVELILVADF